MTRRSRFRKRRGVVLLTTLFFMILFTLLSFALYQLSPSENRTAQRDRTLTEAHFAATAGIRNVKEWITAVAKPEGDPNKANYLGQNWDGHTVSAGSVSYPSLHNDPFSVPATDPNFNQTTLASLQCPYGRFAGLTGMDFLGLAPNVNLSLTDYNAMKAQQGNWLALRSNNPLTVGDYQVHGFVVPSKTTMDIIQGNSGATLRTYMVVVIAYRNNLPVLRARCLLQEESAAKYAYRSNVGDRDVYNNPVTWNISDANSVLFDGPVHTNEVPYINVPSGYWDAALQYFSWDSVARQHPKRAFMGPLTFSGTSTSLEPTLAFDGVGWLGGNYSGTSDTRRPFDNFGNPIASSAQGGNPDPQTGPIANRYDRLIEGGRQAISRISSVPLPENLVSLRDGAFGNPAQTGLDPLLAQVDSTQRNGALPTPTFVRPAYTNSSGATVGAQTYNNNPSADNGIFVNTKTGTTEAAGGIVVKGDARNMYLEVQGPDGKVITDVSALQAGTAVGNPVVRVQATTTSYDSNSGTDIYNHVNQPTWNPPTYVPTGTPTYIPTVPGTAGYTVATVPGYTVATVAGFTVPTGTSPIHGIPGCPSPDYTPPSGEGSGTGTYSCPHRTPATWNPGTPASFVPTVPASYVPGTGTVAGYTQAGAPAHTVAGFTSNNWVPTGAPIGKNPNSYQAQDWVVDVKNTATRIPGSIPLPTGTDENAWRYGVGTEITTTSGNTKTANRLGDHYEPVASDRGIKQVVVHQGASDTTGTPLSSTAVNPGDPGYNAALQDIPVGKVLVYKQSRSDANRLDVFILDRPSNLTTDEQPGGLNGAVYGTGNIHGLRGVNMERKTIGVQYGTNAATDMGIAIIDNVWQFGTPKGNKPVSANHGLGIVAPKLNVQTREASFLDKSLYVYATVIAGSASQTGTGAWPYQGMHVSNANNNTTANFNRTASTTDNNAHRRTVEIFGGLTEQQTKARLQGSKGWSQIMTFDPELSQFPPPFFPSSNLLIPLAYTQESVIGK